VLGGSFVTRAFCGSGTIYQMFSNRDNMDVWLRSRPGIADGNHFNLSYQAGECYKTVERFRKNFVGGGDNWHRARMQFFCVDNVSTFSSSRVWLKQWIATLCHQKLPYHHELYCLLHTQCCDELQISYFRTINVMQHKKMNTTTNSHWFPSMAFLRNNFNKSNKSYII
jgi:hypothetical protein